MSKKLSFAFALLVTFLSVQSGRADRWRTLKNTYAHFSIEYPANWKLYSVSDASPDNDVGIWLRYGDSKRFVRIMVEQGPKTDATSAKSMVENFVSGFKTISRRKTTLGREPAYEITYRDPRLSGEGGLVVRHIGVPHGGFDYFIEIEEHGSDAIHDKDTSDWKYKKEIDRIVKSFRFTK